MGEARNERGQRHHELQERAALHSERENPMRCLVNARGASQRSQVRTDKSRAYARRSGARSGIANSVFGARLGYGIRRTLSSSAVQVLRRERKDFREGADG